MTAVLLLCLVVTGCSGVLWYYGRPVDPPDPLEALRRLWETRS